VLGHTLKTLYVLYFYTYTRRSNTYNPVLPIKYNLNKFRTKTHTVQETGTWYKIHTKFIVPSLFKNPFNNGFFYHGATDLVGQGPIIVDSWSHSDTPRSVGLLWNRHPPDPETCTWQHTTLTRGRIHAPGGIRTHNPSKPAVADSHFRPRGHWDVTDNI
jgi:hypothetical protein